MMTPATFARAATAALLLSLLFPSVPALAQHLRPNDLAGMPVTPPTATERYGTDPLQYGELRLPSGKGPFPVVVIVHGGCWTSGFATLTYMSPLAADLAAKGVATWNVEYRQVGDPGAGWPGSFLDWAAATDYVRHLARTYPLDLSRVVVTGHSAGAHAALWLASRDRLPSSSPIRGGSNPLKIKAAIAIDGPGDIAAWIPTELAICHQPVIEPFMGGSPTEVPDRYAQGNPIALLPVTADEQLVSAVVLTPAQAEAYKQTASQKGQAVGVTLLYNLGHFDMLAPATPAGMQVERLLLDAAGIPAPKP
jgi:acetyl esterase/lipase